MELVCYQRFLLLLLQCLALSIEDLLASGTISVRLLTYENPSSKLANGNCCDAGCRSCDNYFKLCLSPVFSTSASTTSCSLGSFWTDEEGGDRLFTFSSVIWQSMPDNDEFKNPLKFTFDTWTDALNFKVDIYDNDKGVDEWNHPRNDFVDSLSVNLSSKASWDELRAPAQKVTLRAKPRGSVAGPILSVEIGVFCNKNFLIPNCSQRCVDTDDATGHYKCNYTSGRRECLADWYGFQCDKKKPTCVPRNDSLGHYDCHRNGTKRCLPGWKSLDKNFTEAELTSQFSSSSLNSKLSTEASSIGVRYSSTKLLGMVTTTSLHPENSSNRHTSSINIPSSSTKSILPSSTVTMNDKGSSTTFSLGHSIQKSVFADVPAITSSFSGTKQLLQQSTNSPTASATNTVAYRLLSTTLLNITTASHVLNFSNQSLSKPSYLLLNSVHSFTSSPVKSKLLIKSTFLQGQSINELTSESHVDISSYQGQSSNVLTSVRNNASAPVKDRRVSPFWVILLVVPILAAIMMVVYLHRAKHYKRVSRVYPNCKIAESLSLREITDVIPATTTTLYTTTGANPATNQATTTTSHM